MGIQLNKLALKPKSTQSAANISAVRLNYRTDQTQIYPINHRCLISACLIKGELPERTEVTRVSNVALQVGALRVI